MTHEQAFGAALRAAIVNQRMYPSGSPIVTRSVRTCFETVCAALSENPRITLSARQNKLHVNNTEIAEGEAIAAALSEHDANTVVFSAGITEEETAEFVLAISRKPKPDDDLRSRLVGAKAEHVRVEKTTIVELAEGDRVMKAIHGLFEDNMDFPSMVSNLRQAFDMIDGVQDDTGRRTAEESLARKMAAMPAHLIRDLFENPLPKRVEDANLRTMTLNAMTQDKIQDIFSEIGHWYKQVRSQTASEFEVVDQLNKLKSFLKTVLTNPASKEVPFSLYEEMLKTGLLDALPEGVQRKSETETLVFQADKLLENQPAALIEQPVRDKLPAIISRLAAMGMSDLVARLVEHLSRNFSEGHALVRQTAFKSARAVLDDLASAGEEAAWRSLLANVERAAEDESSPEAYGEAARVLGAAARRFILTDRPIDAERLLETLNKHGFNDSGNGARADGAMRALNEAASGVLDVLIDDFSASLPERRERSQRIFAKLGPAAAPLLVRLIKTAPELRHRRLAADALRLAGDAARTALASQLTSAHSTEELLRLLSVMDAFVSTDVIDKLAPLLNEPDPAVQRRLIQLLARIQEPQAEALLMRLLDAADENVLIDALRTLGERKCAAAGAKILEIIKQGNTRKLEEACVALGRIREPRAVPALLDVLETSRGGLFRKKEAVDENVRARAAWALSEIATPEAREALARFSQDSNLQVRDTARRSAGVLPS